MYCSLIISADNYLPYRLQIVCPDIKLCFIQTTNFIRSRESPAYTFDEAPVVQRRQRQLLALHCLQYWKQMQFCNKTEAAMMRRWNANRKTGGTTYSSINFERTHVPCSTAGLKSINIQFQYSSSPTVVLIYIIRGENIVQNERFLLLRVHYKYKALLC